MTSHSIFSGIKNANPSLNINSFEEILFFIVKDISPFKTYPIFCDLVDLFNMIDLFFKYKILCIKFSHPEAESIIV